MRGQDRGRYEASSSGPEMRRSKWGGGGILRSMVREGPTRRAWGGVRSRMGGDPGEGVKGALRAALEILSKDVGRFSAFQAFRGGGNRGRKNIGRRQIKLRGGVWDGQPGYCLAGC